MSDTQQQSAQGSKPTPQVYPTKLKAKSSNIVERVMPKSEKERELRSSSATPPTSRARSPNFGGVAGRLGESRAFNEGPSPQGVAYQAGITSRLMCNSSLVVD
ncbi:hypothetical protein FOZ63_015293, partial [Perkinsus olseni]